MTNKTRKHQKLAKLIKIKRFDHLVNKPAQPKKGISYAVEKAENIDGKTGKKMDGDIFKKYENGVLKRQIFVPKARVKKIIQKSLVKAKKTKRVTVIGGAEAAAAQAAAAAAAAPEYYSSPQYTATRPVSVRIAPTSTQSDPTVSTTAVPTTVSPTVNYTVSPSADLQLAVQQLDNQPFVGIPVQPPV
jgi:hypothetical protein